MEYKSEATGARVNIVPCSFVDAFRLKAVIQKALLSTGKSVEELLDEDLAAVIFAIDSSEDVMNCLFDCLRKSIYNGQAIKPEVFDDLTAREDLYDVFYNCIKVNLLPFLKTILSRLGINLSLDKMKGILQQRLATNSDSSAAASQNKVSLEETQSE